MSWDTNWETIFKERPWGKYPGEDLIRFVARNFYQSPDRSAIKILEVGSGTGANLWFIAREGFQAYGVEGSQTGVELTHQRLNLEVKGWQGNVSQGDITSLPFEDDFFDAVIDIEACSCNSFEDTQKIYLEMARVLKPQGLLYSRAFSTGGDGDGTGKQIGYNFYQAATGPMGGLGNIRYTSEDDIHELLPKSLSLVELDQIVLRGNRTESPVLEWLIIAQK